MDEITIDGVTYIEKSYRNDACYAVKKVSSRADDIEIRDFIYQIPVVYIEESAFNGLPVVNVTLPGCIRCFDTKSFFNCPRLKSIKIKPRCYDTFGISFSSYAVDGCPIEMIDASDHQLTLYSHALANCASLESVKGQIKLIGKNAIAGCKKLKHLVFCANAHAFEYAFGKSYLETVVFRGGISMAKSALNALKKTSIFCTEEFKYIDLVYGGWSITVKPAKELPYN